MGGSRRDWVRGWPDCRTQCAGGWPIASIGAPAGWGNGRKFRSSSCATFRVWYPNEHGNFDQHLTGQIAYGRARLSDPASPPNVKEYAALDRKFPSNSTADQFMDDEQFAAYVELGRWVARRTIGLLAPPAIIDEENQT